MCYANPGLFSLFGTLAADINESSPQGCSNLVQADWLCPELQQGEGSTEGSSKPPLFHMLWLKLWAVWPKEEVAL